MQCSNAGDCTRVDSQDDIADRIAAEHGWLDRAKRSISPLLDEWTVVRHDSSAPSPLSSPSNMLLYVMRYAMRDPLTQLPNRASFANRVDFALETFHNHPDIGFAVLSVDLDRFRIVNESLGTVRGDELLLHTAERISALLGRRETIARVGGDHFAILMDGIPVSNLLSEAKALASRIQHEISGSVTLGRREVSSSVSIGIATASASQSDAEDVIRDAGIALSYAKALGRTRSVVFDSTMHERAINTLDLELDLRKALALGEFELAYQPIASIVDRKVVGYEALIRWRHPIKGLLQPASFLPLLHDTRMILKVGRWVIADACRQASEWAAQCGRIVPIALNLSAEEFCEPGLADEVMAAIAIAGIDPGTLTIEITEGALVGHAGSGEETMTALAASGIRLAIDDFGTGYSSLSYLGRLPVKGLKIPRELVCRIDTHTQDRAIVESIAALAHVLGIEVVAEGVETVSQLEHLRAMKCDQIQGYLVSRPLDAQSALALLGTVP